MRSKVRSLRGPVVIMDLLEVRARELGYPSVNAYLIGLVIYDFLTRRLHTTTVEIARQSPEEQDLIHDEIAQMFRTGETLKGSWFEARMQEAVEKVAKGDDVPMDRVVTVLLDRIKGRK